MLQAQSTASAAGLLEALLSLHSSEAAERFRRLFKRFSGTHTGDSEIDLLNQFWRTQLGVLNRDTISEREWLVNDVDEYTWVKFFERNVLQTVLQENLPQPL